MDTFSFDVWQTPEAAGVSSAGIGKFLDAWQQKKEKVQFHSMILLRHGKIVFKMNVSPYDDITPHMLYSLSKSFTSAAAGFAVSEGLLQWDSSVVDILPEEVPAGREEELRQVTLETLLSMGSGLAEESDSPSPNPAVTWARHVLSHPVKYPPMTHFHYNTFGTYLVSCMVQKVSGMKVRDYLIPRLFAPLGIETPDWDSSPQGVNCGGFGLHLKCDDIARFGQCLLQHGVWQGRQVLPKGWVEFATKEHIANYEGQRQDGNEWGQGYGLQFWRCMDGRYRGDGAYGQACIIDEKRDAVLAVTCGTSDMGAEFQLIREHLFPAVDAPSADEHIQRDVEKRLREQYDDFPADDGSDMALPDGVYFSKYQGVRCGLSLRRGVLDQIMLTLQFEGQDAFVFYLPRGKAGLCAIMPSHATRIRYFGAYGWQQGTLHVSMRSIDGPDTVHGVFTWQGNQLVFDGLGVDFPDGHAEFIKA